MKEFRTTAYECYTNSNLLYGFGHDVTLGFAFNIKNAKEMIKLKGVKGENAKMRLVEVCIIKDDENNILSIEKIKIIKQKEE